MKVEEEMKILEEIDRESIKNGRLLYNYEIKEVLDRFIVKHDNVPAVEEDKIIQCHSMESKSYLDGFKKGYKQAILDGKTNFSRPQGKWICTFHSTFPQYESDEYRCSICNSIGNKTYKFCKNCGARMEGDKKETTFDDYLKEQLKDPEFRKEYEKLCDEDKQKGGKE